MVSKILKALAREGLLVSQRGSKGGYQLARPPESLTVSEMIRVLDGPVALTDCAIGPALCEHETMCSVREPWQMISRVVEKALADVTLADLVQRRASASVPNVSQRSRSSARAAPPLARDERDADERADERVPNGADDGIDEPEDRIAGPIPISSDSRSRTTNTAS